MILIYIRIIQLAIAIHSIVLEIELFICMSVMILQVSSSQGPLYLNNSPLLQLLKITKLNAGKNDSEQITWTQRVYNDELLVYYPMRVF